MNTRTSLERMQRTSGRAGVITGLLLGGLLSVTRADAQAPVNLGTAANFAVLSGQAVTSTQGGTINGNVGVNPGTTFDLGVPPVTVNGTILLGEAVSLQAQNDLIVAYNDAAGRPLPTLILAGQLGGLTLSPGVYRDDGAPAELDLTGTLTLDAGGNPNAVWIFQSASTVIAQVDSAVVLINGAQACNVFWQVTSSATLRTRAAFAGNIIALTSITLENLATLDGRILARNGSVVLDENTIGMPCGQTMLVGVPVDTTVDCNSIPAAPAVIFTDSCSTQSVVAVLAEEVQPGICLNTYAIQRVWSATSSCSGTMSATQMVFVVDALAPVITCPESLIVQCLGDLPPADPAQVVATDGCGGLVTVIHVGDSAPSGLCGGAVTRTYRATDVCGNSSECTQLITVNDTLPPVITCPEGLTVQCVGDVPPADPAQVVATDACGGLVTVIHVGDSVPSGLCGGAVTRTYRATDDCGNFSECTQLITVNDTLPPVITCPEGLSVQCLGDLPPADPARVVATDACGGLVTVIHVGDSVPSGLCGGAVTRTSRATDDCGNFSECTQLITVNDTLPPVITCPEGLSVQCLGDLPPADPARVVATDACGGLVTVIHVGDSVPSGLCGGAVTRTYRATDDCGNFSECTQLITVNDTLPPVITCPEGLTVQCVGDVPPADPAQVVATDACGGLVTVIHVGDSVPSGLCGGAVTRTYRATDDCGNFSECTQLITVNDTLPPVITCPEGLTVQCVGDVPPADPAQVVATDACGGLVTVIHVGDSVPSGLCGGAVTRTYRATDVCGNSSECTQLITVNDTLPPVIECPGRFTDLAGCTSRTNSVPDLRLLVTMSDNCGTVTLLQEPAPGTLYLGTLLVTLTATDDCGNSSSCTTLVDPADCSLCLGDTVWIDVAQDQSTAGDNLVVLGIPNVRLNLYQVTGGIETFVMSTLTAPVAGNNGYYCFPNLPAGRYCVRIDMATVPPGFYLTTPDVYCTNVVTGQSIDTFDFGLIDQSTAIELSSFTATPVAGGVRVDWRTGSEVGNLGFQVTRSDRLNGARVPVNEWLVEGQGTGAGSAYTLMDAGVADGPAFYWLEDFDLDGSSTVHGPVRVRVDASVQSFPLAADPGLQLLPCAAPATMTVRAAGVELPSFALADALLVVAPARGPLHIAPSERPLRMPSADVPPERGEPLQVVVLEEGPATWTVAEGVNAILLHAGPAGAEVVDVSDPAAPVRLTGVLLQVDGHSALYLSARPGARLQAVRR
jgi:hypothetical protein